MKNEKKIFSKEDFDKDKQLFNPEDFEKDKLGSDRSHKQKPVTKLWWKNPWVYVVAAVALLLMVCYIVKDNDDKNENATPTDQVVEVGNNDDTTVVSSSVKAKTDNNVDSTILYEADYVPSTNGMEDASSKETSDTQEKTTSSVSASYNIEQNALRVIRGDFGNGQERKDRLGSAYDEIQSKVNEMYRNGLVK